MRCGWCGQFIGYEDKDAMTYTNFGGHVDMQPPDSIDVCGKCWKKETSYWKRYYKNPKYIWRTIRKLFR